MEEEALTYRVATAEGEFARILQEMRLRSGLTVRGVAERMGVTESSVHQYFYRQRGAGGTSTVKWLLRYAEACGCGLMVTFPESAGAQRRARMTYGRPRGGGQPLAQGCAEGDHHVETGGE
jgi:hypothetical protein